MKNVWFIIQAFGGLEKLQGSYIRLENPGYMPLVIECIGQGPRGLPMVSVTHYYTQNGDIMRDPEMTFEVNTNLLPHVNFLPVTYQQDGIGLYQEAVGRENNQVLVRPRLIKELGAFARMWDRNIGAQGFVEVALKKSSGTFG